jgi:hypothetical protein
MNQHGYGSHGVPLILATPEAAYHVIYIDGRLCVHCHEHQIGVQREEDNHTVVMWPSDPSD